MAEHSGFNDLRDKRLRYVESARENGFEEGLRSLLAELYPANAHFIYELLQNAEDARATVVEFELTDHALTVSHDGTRAFSLVDIESITGIGNSTKKDDETQIGKFGVGFKAVFAYTTRPEIRSGDFSFAIADLFVPELIGGAAQPGQTTFTFPFDRTEKPVDIACAEVERGLRKLDEKTLLFLNTIREITYALPGGDIGFVKRTDLDDVTIRVEASNDEGFVESTWLRLVGPASTAHDGQNPLTVAAAFKLEPKETGKSGSAAKAATPAEAPWRIVALAAGDVSIYFPADKETSRLRFHIHAPFASTVARDSVRDTPENAQLVADIGNLIVRNLNRFRDRGLISDGFLASLPNADDDLRPMFGQVRSAILGAFNDDELTPIRGGGFGAARTLVSSPVELRRLLREPDLAVLFGLAGVESNLAPRWIGDRDGRPGRFLAGLDSIDFGWSEVSRILGAVQERPRPVWDSDRLVSGPDANRLTAFGEWLASKADAELLDFYQLLGFGRTNHRLNSNGLATIPMIRIRKRGKAHHVKGGDVFLPASRSDNAKSRVPVELAYFDDDDDERSNNLRAFYHAAGVERWNEKAKVEARLKKYAAGARPIPSSDAEVVQHVDDVRGFVRFASGNKGVAHELFAHVKFLLSQQSNGSLRWVSPSQTFLDTPFTDTGLSSLYPRVPLVFEGTNEFAWDREPYPVPGIYLDVEGIEVLLRAAGCKAGIKITPASVFNNPQLRREWWSNNRHSAYTQMRDWQIENLAKIIETGDPTLLQTLWDTAVDADAAKAKAVYQANASAVPHDDFDSQLAQQLTTTAWVLDRDGQLRRPREISLDELRDGWKRPGEASLARKLNFGAEATRHEQREAAMPLYAQQLGIDLEDVELLKKAHAVGLNLREMIAEKLSQEAFPEGASEDPDRRAAAAALDAASAATHQTDIRSRSVVVGQPQSSEESRSYLREQYTNPGGDMYCQACHAVLPFKVKSEWYFQSIQFVYTRKQVHRQNALALCPLCAALYRHKRETSDEALLDSLLALDIEPGQGAIELPVLINGRVVRLRFTGKHGLDLQSAMAVAGDERSSD